MFVSTVVCPHVFSTAMPEGGGVQTNHRSLRTETQPGFDCPCVPVDASVLSKANIPVDPARSGVLQSSANAEATRSTRNVTVPADENGALPTWNVNGCPALATKRATVCTPPPSSLHETGAPGGHVSPP